MRGDELQFERFRRAIHCLSRVTDRLPQTEKPPPHILVVDDIEDNREMLRRRFESRGFRISEAASGEAALELINSETFDAILLDVMMPDIDGFEVLRRLRALPGAMLIPVIMVTARAQSKDVIAALDGGADDYVTKPVDFAVALARVKTQLARSEAQRLIMQAASQLEYLAYHDSLTGLGNRSHFMNRLEHAVETLNGPGNMLSVMFIDLDGFKAVNDSLGHQAGDNLLQQIASGLNKVAATDCCIARLGGDEFAILTTGLNLRDSSRQLAEKIIQMIAGITRIAGHEVRVGASVGIALQQGPGARCENILRDADHAMYRAKLAGKGQFQFAEMSALCNVA